MITKITDKMDREYAFDWYFDQNGVYYEATDIYVYPPSGCSTLFIRSVSTSVCTISNVDGGTLLKKQVSTPLTGDASRGRYMDDYKDASNYEQWGYEYDGGGDKTKDTRPGGGADSTFGYNTKGQFTTVTTVAGVSSSFSYGSDSLTLTKTTDPAALDTTYSYDGSNRVTKVVTPTTGSNGVVYGYDAYGQATSATNPQSQSTTYAYDSVGRMTSAKDPLNNETKYEYDNQGNKTKVIDPRNKATYYYYAYAGCGGCGGGGLLTKIKDPLNNETVFAYDSNGNRTKVTDAMGVVTDYFYDLVNQLTKVESPSASGTYMTMAYDKQGQMTSSTDFNGKTSSFFFDFQGRMTKQSDSVGDYVTNAYDSFGNLSTVTDGGGKVTDYDYDADNRLTKVNYDGGKVTKYFYDSAGRRTKVGGGSDGSVDPIEYFVDSTTGLMTKTRYSSGGNNYDATYAYDTAKRLTKLTDWIDWNAGADDLVYAYDAAGRLLTLTDYDDSTLIYAYDAAGNVTSMADYHGNATTYTYTDRNELSTITAPGSKVWSFTYNALGQPWVTTTANNMVTSYTYDGRNRLVGIAHKTALLFGTTRASFDYALNAGGNITRTTDKDGAYWDYEYDGRDRLTKATSNNSGATIKGTYTYTYDAGDNMVTKVEPFKDDFNDGNYTGWTVGWGAWSAANNILETTGSGWNAMRKSSTDADHEVSLSYNINDTSDSNYRLYVCPRYVDSSNLVWVLIKPGSIQLGKVVSGTWTTLGTYTVTSSANTWYDLRFVCNGNNVQVWRTVSGSIAVKILETSSAGVTTTNYLHIENSPSSTFDLDNVRVLADDLSSTATFGYTSANELTTMTDPNGTTSFTYDAWGRMTSKSQGSYSATYAYRYGDKLYSVSSDFPGEGGVTYQYGADQKRRERTVGGTTTKYKWDSGWGVISEDDTSGNLLTTYVGHTLADISGSNPATGTTRYYFQDNIGSMRLLCDSSKAAIGTYDYEPYGGSYAGSGASATHKFTGHDWDSAAQMYFAPYRYYAPNFARWLSRDPLGRVDGPNVYGYVSASPIWTIDELGLSSWTDFVDWVGGHRGDFLDCLGNCLERGPDDCRSGEWPPPTSGISAPVWPIIPKWLAGWFGVPVRTIDGASNWTTPIRILKIKTVKVMPPGWERWFNWMGKLSKLGPWLTILDGAISWWDIARCSAHCSK